MTAFGKLDGNLLTALQDGVTFPFQATKVIVQGLAAVVTGQVPGGLFGKEGLTGPIGIAAITSDAVNQGPATYLWLVALLSVALGVTNLLPLTLLNDALREISVQGATLWDVRSEILGLLIWTVAGFILAVRLFRFEKF